MEGSLGSRGILKPSLLPYVNHCNNPQTSLPLGISQKPPTLPKVTRSLKQGSRHAVHCFDTSNSSPIIFHMEEGLLTLAPGAVQFITASSPSTNLPLVPACALYPWTIHCHICLLFHLLLRFPCNSISRPSASPGKILMHPLPLLKGPF